MKFVQKQAIAALAALALISFAPMAAHAHDEVVSTSPAADSTVAPGPITVSVTFNEDIMKSADLAGEVIEIVDSREDHLTLSLGCLHVDGPTLSTSVNITQAGDYTVNWRSVSNDGHPNEGSFQFKVDNTNLTDNNGMSSAETGACPAEYTAVDKAANPSAIPLGMAVPTKTQPKANPFIQNLPYLGVGILLVFLGAIAGPIAQRVRSKRAAEKAALKQLMDEEN